jgi:hypothetical protein
MILISLTRCTAFLLLEWFPYLGFNREIQRFQRICQKTHLPCLPRIMGCCCCKSNQYHCSVQGEDQLVNAVFVRNHTGYCSPVLDARLSEKLRKWNSKRSIVDNLHYRAVLYRLLVCPQDFEGEALMDLVHSAYRKHCCWLGITVIG